MGLVVRQVLASSRSTATSLARTFASAVLSGSLLVAGSQYFASGQSAEATVSDSVNGTWGTAATTGVFLELADGFLQINAFPNSAAGTPQVTMNPPGTSSDNDLTLFEVTGAATSSPRDVSVTASGSGVNPSVSSGVLAQANEILFGSFTQDSSTTSFTIGGGFTQQDENEDNSTGQCYNIGSLIVSSTSSVNKTDTMGASANWIAVMCSYKEAAAGAATLVKRIPTYRPAPFRPGAASRGVK